ncbi:hypothetical protein D6833_10375 [Candidatus Parcubacteria bacterium]|nr:MAG: hypothetical protein D6833_10375 [Candidatus Parcubacteria bacterium]
MSKILIEEAIRAMALVGVVIFAVLPVAHMLGADVGRVARFAFPVPFLIFLIFVWIRARTGWKLQITTRRAWWGWLAFVVVSGLGLNLLYVVSEYASLDRIVVTTIIGLFVVGVSGWLGTRLMRLQ